MNDFFLLVAKRKPLLTIGTNYNIRVIWGKKNLENKKNFEGPFFH
jgi:hypothetical protein